mgnify:CR=1 FL=1
MENKTGNNTNNRQTTRKRQVARAGAGGLQISESGFSMPGTISNEVMNHFAVG